MEMLQFFIQNVTYSQINFIKSAAILQKILDASWEGSRVARPLRRSHLSLSMKNYKEKIRFHQRTLLFDEKLLYPSFLADGSHVENVHTSTTYQRMFVSGHPIEGRHRMVLWKTKKNSGNNQPNQTLEEKVPSWITRSGNKRCDGVLENLLEGFATVYAYFYRRRSGEAVDLLHVLFNNVICNGTLHIMEHFT